MDEWTDNTTKRYLNVTLRSYIDINSATKPFDHHVLGLVQIDKGRAENIEIYVKKILGEFDIDIDSDIIASTHDAAAVMVKYGNNISAISQLCHNHGIHLAVVDLFYKKQDQNHPELESPNVDYDLSEFEDILSNDEDDDDDGNESDFFNTECEFSLENANVNFESTEELHVNLIEVIPNVNKIIKKIRKVVKIFRKSPDKNNKLQEYVVKKEKKGCAFLLI